MNPGKKSQVGFRSLGTQTHRNPVLDPVQLGLLATAVFPWASFGPMTSTIINVKRCAIAMLAQPLASIVNCRILANVDKRL